MTSRLSFISVWLLCVVVWVIAQQYLHHDADIAVVRIPEADAATQFQSPELWNNTIPFRWSSASITVQLPVPVSDYTIIDVVAIGHHVQQRVEFQYQYTTTQPVVFHTVDMQFRHYQTVVIAHPVWVPRWQYPLLAMTTDSMTTDGRVIGLGMQRIKTTSEMAYGWVFVWELLWVAVCLWVCVCAMSSFWRTWQWGIVGVVLGMLIGVAYGALPPLASRYITIVAMVLFFAYERLPQPLYAQIRRVAWWLFAPVPRQPSVPQRIINDWFVSVGLAGVAVVLVVWLRQGNPDEMWDKYIFLTVFMVSACYIVLREYLDGRIRFDFRFVVLGRTFVVTSWVLLVLNGFQNEGLRDDVIPRFVGFGGWFLLLVVAIGPCVRWFLDDDTPNRWRTLFGQIFATWVVVASCFTLLVGNDYYHNLFVVNETLIPAVGRFAYDDFIPQYTTMFNGLMTLYTAIYHHYSPMEIIDFSVLIMKATGGGISVVLVYMVYRVLPRPSWAKAVLLTLPMVFMASYPIWHKVIVSTLSADFYSIVPVRFFAVVMVGFVGTTVLLRYKASIRAHVYVMLGVFVGLVIFNNNDFGFMAAVALAATIVMSPYVSRWRQKILSMIWYGSGIVLFFPIMVGVNWIGSGRQFNNDYVFWFVRQFGGGFGALMIRYPGPGVMIIAVTLPLALAALRSLFSQRQADVAWSSRMMTGYMQVCYFAVISCMSLLYYLNRSTANNLGVTLIPLMVAFVSLWALDVQLSRQHRSLMRFVVQCVLAIPVAIGMVFMNVPDMSHLSYRFSERIATDNSQQLIDEMRTFPLQSATVLAQQLSEAGFHPGYYGPWANIMQVYTQIPSAMIFNHPVDGLQSNNAKAVLCAHAFSAGIDALIVPKSLFQEPVLCTNFAIYDDVALSMPVALNRADAQFVQHDAQLQKLIQACRVDALGCMSRTKNK